MKLVTFGFRNIIIKIYLMKNYTKHTISTYFFAEFRGGISKKLKTHAHRGNPQQTLSHLECVRVIIYV